MFLRAFFGLVWVAGPAILAGCGGNDHPETVPVAGTVTYKGAPVEGAQVSFMAPGAPRAAIGTTNSQGKFQLTTFEENDGAVIGKHAVTISKSGADQPAGGMDAMNPSDAYGQAMGAAASGTGAEEGELPARYANPQSSGLEAEVTRDGTNDFTFPLE
jgi:hypothetical protein